MQKIQKVKHWFIAFDVPEQQLKFVDKQGCVILAGNFETEKDILEAFCDKVGLHKEFCYKLDINKLELYESIRSVFNKNIIAAYSVQPNQNSSNEKEFKKLCI